VRRFVEANRRELPEVLLLKDLDLKKVKKLVCVDVSSGDRMGPLAELAGPESGLSLDVYDHHADSGDLRGDKYFVREAGACTTIMLELLEQANLTPSPFEATLFLLAIYEDTGFLTYPTTRPQDFEAVLKCLRWGGDLGQVTRVLRRGFTEDQLRLLATLFENLESVPVGGVRVHLTTLSAPDYVPDVSLLVHEILAIEELEALFLLAYMENRVHIIGRSRTPHVNVGEVLEVFGGGGHPSAASAVVRDKTLLEVKALLLDEITQVRPVGLKARDIMTRDFRRMASRVSIREAFQEMNRYRVNALPVFRGDGLVGVVTRQEVDGAMHHNLGDTPISDFVISQPPLLSADTPAEEVRRLMMEHNWRVVLFGESPDAVEGLLSRMTLFKTLYRQSQGQAQRRAGGQPSPKEMGHLVAGAFSPDEVAHLQSLGALAASRSETCLLVGGAVRDLLLGRAVQDVDFVVEGDAVGLAEAWAAQEGGRIRAHKAFGTAVWIRPDGSHWDFATARAEYYETPAALPTVAHAALYQDLYRRDFTMNTLALYIGPERFGEILDLFGGVRDLKAGRIRVMHGLSFVEDPTRAFRAIRFAVRLGFTLPPETERLIAATAKQGVFRHLSPKRVLAEVNQILSGTNAVEGLKAMEAYKLLAVFWPAFKLTPRVLETLYRVQKALDFFETHFPDESLDKPCVYFMALLERVPTANLMAFLKHYPVPRETKDVLERFRSITWHALRDLGREERETAGATYRALVDQPLTWVLFLLSKVEPAAKQALVRDFLVRDRFTKLEITGRDLIKAGVPASSAIARALLEARVAKVDRKIKGRREELAFALAAAEPVTGKGRESS
jgi:tRNA nucleotidyltransferase (CCA-adding enzyme)